MDSVTYNYMKFMKKIFIGLKSNIQLIAQSDGMFLNLLQLMSEFCNLQH